MSKSKELQITSVKPEDNLGLAKMIRGVFDEYQAPTAGTVYVDPTTDHLSDLFQTENSVLFVAKDNEGEIVGCCGLYPTDNLPKDYVELVKFYIGNSARGTGLGRKFLELCYEKATEMGYTHLYLESIPAFAKAISIYEKQGFITLDKPLGNSGHNGCDIWMLKEL